jgi:ketosteroid isomerase-like protein
MPSDERDVLAANRSFYESFNGGDLPAIEALWADEGPVVCIHPGWDALHGREEVLESFRAILSGQSAPEVECVGPSAIVRGEMGVVVCGEMVDGAYLAATNVFVKVGAAWRMVHHQAGPVARRREGRRAEGAKTVKKEMLN